MKQLTFIATILSFAAHAVKPIATGDIINRCTNLQQSPAPPSAVYCKAWMHGFLAGLFATPD